MFTWVDEDSHGHTHHCGTGLDLPPTCIIRSITAVASTTCIMASCAVCRTQPSNMQSYVPDCGLADACDTVGGCISKRHHPPCVLDVVALAAFVE